jgi:MFS family permease
MQVVFTYRLTLMTAGATNWAGLVTLRVLLGCFEAVIAPALVLITSMWYKRSEQPLRVGLWYMGTGVAQMIGGLLSYGFQFYTGDRFHSWQIMFLVLGLVTIVVGMLVVWLMPDNPMTAKFLTREEKVYAIERLRDNKTGIENKHFKPAQVWECLCDPQSWLICGLKILSAIPNGAVSSYQAAIINSFGYTSKQTALLSIGSGAVAVTSTLVVAWFGGRFNANGPGVIALLSVGGLLGGSLVAFSPRENEGAQLAGQFLTNVIGSSMTLLLAYSATNIAGYTKKVTMNAMLLIAFCKQTPPPLHRRSRYTIYHISNCTDLRRPISQASVTLSAP